MQVLPIDVTSVVAIVMGMLVVLIPVAGFTARFAFKPIADAIARMREGQGATREMQIMEKRVALLEQQLQSMEGTMERLVEERDFHRQLEAPR